MRSLLVSVAFLAAAAVSLGQTHYAVSIHGQSAGTATLTIQKLKDGGMVQKEVFDVSFGGNTGVQSTEIWLSREGEVQRETQSLSGMGRSATQVLTISGRTATMRSTIDGKKSTVVEKAPVGAKITDPSPYWFMTVKPKLGESVHFWAFSFRLSKWCSDSAAYVRDSGGGHEIDIHQSGLTVKAIVDSHGIPISLDQSGGVKLTRQ